MEGNLMKRLRRRAGTMEYLQEQHDLVVLKPEEYRGQWQDYFNNDQPIYVELGMGKGKFITEMSAMYPEINFIGIDLYDELVRKASEKALDSAGEDVEGGSSSQTRNLALALYNIEKLENVFASGEI